MQGDAVGREACGCGRAVVFEGATIGQVFTGDVAMDCPVRGAGSTCATVQPKERSRGGHAAVSSLLTLAVWQTCLAMPSAPLAPSTHASQAAWLFTASALVAALRSRKARRALVALAKAIRRSRFPFPARW